MIGSKKLDPFVVYRRFILKTTAPLSGQRAVCIQGIPKNILNYFH